MSKIMKRGFAGLMIAGLLNTQIQAASLTAVDEAAAASTLVASAYVPSERELREIASLRECIAAGAVEPVMYYQNFTHFASSGYQAAVDYVISAHADNLSEFAIKMALFGASESGHLVVVQRLCQIPGGLKPTQEAIAMALSRASTRQQTDVVQYLLTLNPDQASINKALTDYMFSFAPSVNGVSTLLKALTIDQEGRKQAFFSALRNRKLSLAAFLMAPENGLTLDQQDVNTAFAQQAERTVHVFDVQLLQFLMQLEGYPRPDQAGMNQAFLAVTSVEKKNCILQRNLVSTMSFLLSGTVKPDEATMNASLKAAARQGHEDALKLLLDQPEGTPRPDQATVNAVLLEVAGQNNISRDLWDVLLAKTRVLKPDQNTVNQAFLRSMLTGINSCGNPYFATENMGPDLACLETAIAELEAGRIPERERGSLTFHYQQVYKNSLVDSVGDEELTRELRDTLASMANWEFQTMKRLVSLTNGMNADNRARIINMYREFEGEFTRIVDRARDNEALQAMDHASPAYYEALRANLAQPMPGITYVGGGAVAPHAHGSGVAFEVHNYANTQVTAPMAGAVGAPKTGSLTDMIQAHIASRITASGTPLVAYEDARDAVLAWIDGHIEETARDSARLAIHHGLGVAGSHMELQNAYTFVTALRPEALDVWINGFVTESMTAYIHRNDQTSCVKGISERIITGLRGIDPELDTIFAKPEGILHAKKLISLLNPAEPEKLAWIVRVLRSIGVTKELPAAEAMARFKAFLIEKLEGHGLSEIDMADYTSQAHLGVEALEDVYDQRIRIALESASVDTVSVAGASTASS